MEIEERVRTALFSVLDPELGINVVDLGLVYGVQADSREVRVQMTMTTPACPLHASMRRDVESVIRRVCPGVESVVVDLVWEPPWDPSRMSEDAKRLLGWAD